MTFTVGLLKQIFFISLIFLLSCKGKETEELPSTTTTRPLLISPASTILAINNLATFSATGGTAPYTYIVYRGFGTVNESTGVFTAAPVQGSAVVRVIDANGLFAEGNITVNPALQISPLTKNIAINTTLKFTSSGGVPPLTFSKVSGVGVINATTGIYTAPATAGTAAIRVTDSKGNVSNATVNVIAALTLTPPTATLAVNNTKSFVATGGVTPYTYSVVSGSGIINASTGMYTAGSSPGTTVVRVTDAAGVTANSTITVNPALAILPNSQTMSSNGILNFSASGGVSPYAYSIVSGGGSVAATSGVFTAPGSAGTTVVRVIDSYGNFADSTVTIILGLGISPAAVTLAVTNTQTFTATGGTGPYAFSVVTPSGGTINSSTGVYTAPGTAGSYIIRATDSIGAVADATVTVNPALQMAPATKTLVINSTFTFSATGGVSPYTFSVSSGGGSIDPSTGTYTAPATPGTATVRVTDNKGNTSTATITINDVLAIQSAGNISLISVLDTLAFSASGGISPYTFSILSGAGSINSSTGLYTPSTPDTVTIRVTDSVSATSDFELQVSPALTVTPTTGYVTTNGDIFLSGVDGVPPYSYAVFSGGGIIDPASGAYTADPTTGTAIVRVTDFFNHTADANMIIYDSLLLSPLSVTMAVSSTQNFTASGGFGALTFSVVSGLGSINSSGVFSSSPSGGPVVVRVQDSIGNFVEANIDVVSSLTISPKTLSLPVFSTAKFTSVLGTAPFTYSVTAGTGTIVAGTGVYTAPSVVGSGTVQVDDSATNTSTATVTHIIPIEIVTGAYHTCVRYDNGGVKCWGLGSSGQLGNGSTANIGSTTAQVGGAIPFVNLGTGRTATALAAGINHTCAILDNATVKCWGLNTYGQLGYGNVTTYGTSSAQMGNSLPTVSLGTGRTALKIFAYGYVTCVILDNSATKCFGRNNYGQLGQDNLINYGSASGQMGDSLPAINLGSGRSAVKVVGGLDYTCALLDNATVKCFGRAFYGQTGYNSTATTGSTTGSMAALPVVDFGTGRTVLDIAGTYSHSCVVLDNFTVKCWGRNQTGQLGYGNLTNYGDTAGDMGNNLPTVPLTTFTPVKVWAGRQWSCAANSSNMVRCWGLNSTGQLMVGNTTTLGDGAGEVAALVNINFGTSVVMSSLSVGYYFGCAIMTNNRIKCFGSAANNALLNASTTVNLGDSAGELADGLNYLNH